MPRKKTLIQIYPIRNELQIFGKNDTFRIFIWITTDLTCVFVCGTRKILSVPHVFWVSFKILITWDVVTANVLVKMIYIRLRIRAYQWRHKIERKKYANYGFRVENCSANIHQSGTHNHIYRRQMTQRSRTRRAARTWNFHLTLFNV